MAGATDNTPVFGDAAAQDEARRAWERLRAYGLEPYTHPSLPDDFDPETDRAQRFSRAAAVPERTHEGRFERPPVSRPAASPPPERRTAIWGDVERPAVPVQQVARVGSGAWLLRRFIVLLALTPILLLLTTRVANLQVDPVLGLYAVLTLLTTATVMYVAFARYRDPSLDAPPLTRLPYVSIMVAVKDERELISRCVISLLESTYANKEVIVVDDGSTDGTSERLDALRADFPDLHVLHLERSHGKKRALTHAAAHARGELLVFTDSDCVVKSDAIERVVMAFAADPDLGACSGHARALNAEQNFLTRVQDTWYEGQFSVWKAAEAAYGSVTCISGPLAAFRREAIFNYFPAWAEDRFMGQEFRFATDRQLTGYVLGNHIVGRKLKRKYAESEFLNHEDHRTRRWNVGYVKSARVWTEVPDTPRRMIKQQVRWKKSFLRSLFFTGKFYWRRGVVPAFLFYSHVLFILLMPFMVLRHLVWLPAHGLWLLTGLYLCGLFFKGSIWALAYKAENPRDHKWVYRPFMSLMTAFFGPLILYSALTIRRNVWSRG